MVSVRPELSDKGFSESLARAKIILKFRRKFAGLKAKNYDILLRLSAKSKFEVNP